VTVTSSLLKLSNVIR